VQSQIKCFLQRNDLNQVYNISMLHKILGSSISTTSYSAATAQILTWARAGESRSVYAANVHMVMEAYDHADFRTAVNGADLVTPDGMPLVWALRRKGVNGQSRVYGPTLMLEVLRAAECEGIAVGFLGSTAEIRQAMLARFAVEFPRLRVCPLPEMPFGAQSAEDDAALTTQIEAAGARILFVALGCPAQERWIAAHRGRIHAVMLGVGAAFAFHAGAVRQAPGWMQRLGLEWLFRLTQEPGRLWKRYLKHNPRFLILEGIELIRDKMK